MIDASMRPCNYKQVKRSSGNSLVGENTLNDLESNHQMNRSATYDDTARISNQMMWLSDYSHSQYDTGKDLNDDILTPIRAVAGSDAMNYYKNMHNFSRFGCEKS